ncbi:pentatricopeptide repeat-containing protein At1g63330-like isoform X2 [Andrographis paniculata]|uniref:pentatricopeptide repeat-containing protein At1g63330-like isoform X2 n=1 Tax=Andrographis paniculata TaxID=175694 RepID=UPI0021E6E727|nr:pentatricopeptide repeat-containing protein At1g63330-like isoform X2 [Andrographis paniculata]
MAVKLSSSIVSRRIPNWVSLKANLSSISCAINYLHPTSESDNCIPSNSPDLEAKIQRLKNNKLCSATLISVLEGTPDLNSSIKLFKWASRQKQFRPTAETYRMLILKLGLAGNLSEMERFCNEMVRVRCCGFEKSLLSLIDSFVGDRRFSEALRVVYAMNSNGCSHHLSIETFNSLMRVLMEEKSDFKDVVFVYKEMVKAGIAPNVDTLNYLLEGLFESGRVDTAMDQYRRMGRKGCEPNVRTFEIVVRGLAYADHVGESVAVLEEMFRSGCEADAKFYVCVVPIFCGMKNLDVGLRLFGMMRASNVDPDCATYSAVIRCLCEFLRLDDAIKLLEEMRGKGVMPESRVYVDIIDGLCKLNKLAEAEDILVENGIFDPYLHNMILGSYCKNGIFPKGMFDKMLESGALDATSWNILIGFLCKKSMIDEALEWLCRMVISSFHPNSDTYSSLILGNCKAGKFSNGLDLFASIKSKDWVLDSVTYAELVECLCETGNVREAANVFRYMASKGCALRSSSFNFLIGKICAGGDVYKAVGLLPLAYCCETYSIVIRYMSATNQAGSCVSVFNLMLSVGVMPDAEALARLLSCLAKNSRVHSILRSMDKIALESEFLDPVVYNLLIRSLWNEGFETEARRVLDKILEMGRVPDASTHALLVGSVETDDVKGNHRNDDSVSCILEEGLGKTKRDKRSHSCTVFR